MTSQGGQTMVEFCVISGLVLLAGTLSTRLYWKSYQRNLCEQKRLQEKYRELKTLIARDPQRSEIADEFQCDGKKYVVAIKNLNEVKWPK